MKKILLISIVLFCTMASYGQEKESSKTDKVDRKPAAIGTAVRNAINPGTTNTSDEDRGRIAGGRAYSKSKAREDAQKAKQQKQQQLKTIKEKKKRLQQEKKRVRENGRLAMREIRETRERFRREGGNYRAPAGIEN